MTARARIRCHPAPGARRRARRRRRGRRGLGDGIAAARRSAASRAEGSRGSTSTPASGVTNSGGPPSRGDHRPLHRHRLQRRQPERLGQRRLAEDVARGVSRTGPRRAGRGRRRSTPARPSRSPRSGPSPTKTSEPRPRTANASASAATFLRAISEPTQRKRGRASSPATPRAASPGSNCVRSTPRSQTSQASAGEVRSSRVGQPARVRDHRRGAAHDRPRRQPQRRAVEVGDVLAVGHDDQRDARGARRRQARRARREEEVREDDVGPEAPRGAASRRRVSRAYLAFPPPRCPIAATSTSWPWATQLAAQRQQEAAEVGLGRRRPHLGHEQDAHGASTACHAGPPNSLHAR